MIKRKIIVKAVTYRLFSSCITLGISFFTTHNLKISITISVLETITKVVVYYLHEFIWENKK